MALRVVTIVLAVFASVFAMVDILLAAVSIEPAFPNLTFEYPVDIQDPGDGSERLFVVGKQGKIWGFKNDPAAADATVFLDLSERVSEGDEEGLLALTFHPLYERNGLFFVSYTLDEPGRNRVSRFRVSTADPNRADPSSEVVFLEIEDSRPGHNLHRLVFGPDDRLYIGSGDGGCCGDPLNVAQRLNDLRGKLLRIDVDGRSGELRYAIPADNPFAGLEGIRQEIYAYGLRNPWEFSFDERGRLWLADVGQDSWEEIDWIRPGENYGWDRVEGTHCFDPTVRCLRPGLIPPIWEYRHVFEADGGFSVIGGEVYRGESAPDLMGKYIFADFSTGNIWAMTFDSGGATDVENVVELPGFNISAFQSDSNDELYGLVYGRAGHVFKFVGEPEKVELVDLGAPAIIDFGNPQGGIAVIDFDNDGFQDLVIADDTGAPNRLFRNVPRFLPFGARTFLDVTAGSELNDAEGIERVSVGVVVADYDNDGDHDIFMTGYSEREGDSGLLYRNEGGGRFSNVTQESGLRLAGYRCMFKTSVSWCDYDLDRNLDLFLVADTGSPSTFVLMRNNGDGTFSNASGLLPELNQYLGAFAHIWLDIDDDDDPDLLTVVDGQPSVLLHNVAAGSEFVNVGTSVGFNSVVEGGGSGIAAGDIDNDLDVDIAISGSTVGHYFENLGGTFERIHPFDSIPGWGVAWFDVDNDGDVDFYGGGSYGDASRYDKLFRNDGEERFVDISGSILGVPAQTKYSVQLDYNNDGRQDIIAVSPGQFVSVYENRSFTRNHWIEVKLEGSGPVNRDAIGARVFVTAGRLVERRDLVSGSSTTSTEDLRLHFGLGTAEVVDVIRVAWPRRRGAASTIETFPGPFAVDQIVTFRYESDCNRNGTEDFIDIAIGSSEDVNNNDRPDECECDSPLFIRGDANRDGAVDVTDASSILRHIFLGGAQPVPLVAADVNSDDRIDVTDAISLLSFLFLGDRQPPAPPYPDYGCDS